MFVLAPREKRTERPLAQKSAGKVLARVFWDSDGILLINDLEHGKTINADYYIALLDRLDAILREKCKCAQRKKICFFTTMQRHTNRLKQWQNWATNWFSI